MLIAQHIHTNKILNVLPHATLARLQPSLVRVDTKYGQVLHHLDGAAKYYYFVDRGLISLVKTMLDGRTVEISAIGIEGVTSSNSLFGVENAMLDSIVQIPGTVYRIRREILSHEIAHNEEFRKLMERYAAFAIEQIIQTAACNRLHSLDERCCRWLLMAHDSALSNTFPLTHHYLSMMLGVQRSGVTITARTLKKAGLIDYTRGQVSILDRPGLEESSCECYRTIHAQLGKIFAA